MKTLRMVIDPGHGGSDSGATRKDVKESNLVLDVALKLDDLIKSSGWPIEHILTRYDDTALTLTERSDMSREWRAKWILHIHCDSNTAPYLRGSTCYYWPRNKKGYSMADFLQHRAPELLLRKLIQPIEATDLPGRDDDWKMRARNVMMGHKGTCTLVELCWLTNEYDLELIQKDHIRRNLATWLFYVVTRAMEIWVD
jgi:N-acetylmuramoyl-L-alanine amidase